MAALTALAGCGSIAGRQAETPVNAALSAKAFAILVRKAGRSADQFRRRWLGYNGQLARRLQGLGGLVFSESFGAGAMAAPASSYPKPIDGFAQAWFADAIAMEAALDTQAGKEWLADESEFLDRGSSRTYRLHEEAVVAPMRIEGAIKRTLLLVRRPDLTHEQFLDHWLTRHADLAKGVPGLTGAVFNTVLSEIGSDESPWREFDGIAETWWETGPDDLGGKPSSPEADKWMGDASNFLDLPRCRTIASIEHVLIEPK
jgi:hypothetical protein